MDLRWRGSFNFCASITMSKHRIDLHHMSYIKHGHLHHNSAFATTSDYNTIDVSHTTLVLINPNHALDIRLQPWSWAKSPFDPLSTWSHICDHMCVRKRSLRRARINDPRYCTVAIVAWTFITTCFTLIALTFSTFCQPRIFLIPHNLHVKTLGLHS